MPPCTTAPKMHTFQSWRAPPRSQVLCFGGTGPIHTPLIKHLPPPVPTKKNPTVKSTSSSLRPLSALLCLSLLSRKGKSVHFHETPQHSLCSEPPGPQTSDPELFIKEPISEKVTHSKFTKRDSPA